MASLRFVIEDDGPVELATTGSLLDIVSCITYLVNKVYRTFGQSDPKVAAVFRSMIVRTMADPDSPVWTEAGQEEGETAIAINLPPRDDRHG